MPARSTRSARSGASRSVRVNTQDVGFIPKVYGPKAPSSRRSRGGRTGRRSTGGRSRRSRAWPSTSATAWGPSSIVRGWDATDEMHVPLPRPVGGYSIVRTTQTMVSAKKILIFGCFQRSRSNEEDWTNAMAIGPVDPALPINATNNTDLFVQANMQGSGWDSCRLAPAAITVQAMNPSALNTTSGILYFGRAKQVLDLRSDTRTWDAVADALVSYSEPRLVAAGKLALRGIADSCIPYNWGQLAQFTPLRNYEPGAVIQVTLNDAGPYLEGFNPLFVVNPDPQTNVQYLVTIEWRVRFDPGNPAYAAHRHHGVSSDTHLSSAISTAESMPPWPDLVNRNAQKMGRPLIGRRGPRFNQFE